MIQDDWTAEQREVYNAVAKAFKEFTQASRRAELCRREDSKTKAWAKAFELEKVYRDLAKKRDAVFARRRSKK